MKRVKTLALSLFATMTLGGAWYLSNPTHPAIAANNEMGCCCALKDWGNWDCAANTEEVCDQDKEAMGGTWKWTPGVCK